MSTSGAWTMEACMGLLVLIPGDPGYGVPVGGVTVNEIPFTTSIDTLGVTSTSTSAIGQFLSLCRSTRDMVNINACAVIGKV